ncbi:MAG: fibrinogen-like YCDxxxxGGGW domain-containing protein, partial [Myxococcota bacterium]|nr:fibrinogen-like YCDxxxxGGGW domain-containing protein [Myxococcota bacterium]
GQDVVLSGGGCAPGVDGCPDDGVQADVCWADLKWYQIACGDGVLDDGEVCDDGNLDGGDGCAQDCSAIGQPLAYYDMEEGLGQTLYNKSPRYSGAFSGTLNYDAQFSADGNLTGGYHLTFDGNQDHARFAEGWEQDGEDVWLAADGFSLALWVNIHALPEEFFGSDHSNFWQDYDQLLNLGDAGYLGLSPYQEGGWNFGFNYDQLDAPYTVYSGLDHPAYVAGEWVHVVGTYDGNWMRLYLNGTEAASQQVGKVQHVYWSNADTDDGALGAGTRGETRYLNGAIDEFSMWDVALGPDLVADLYNGGLPVRADQLGAEPVCGDGVFQPGEACDDGNLVALDGCEPNCTLTVEGDTCASAIYIPTDDFVAVSCPDGPCVQAVVTGSTVGANDAHEVTDDALCPSVDDGAVAGAPDVSYTFDNLAGWSLKTVLEGDFDAVVAIQDGPASVGCDDLGEVCLHWPQGGATGIAPKEPDAAWITVDGYTPEDQGSFTLTLELYACGNGVNDFHMGETCDDGNQVDGDGCSAGCVLEAEETPRDCAGVGEISPETGSGLYDIDLDGPLGAPPIQVFCDMETRGGGWTVMTAFDIEHYLDYRFYGFDKDFPRNPDAHNWDDYRLGEHELTTLMDRSDEVHARCHRDFASSSDDYLFGPIALVRHDHNGSQVGQGTGIVTGRIRGHDIQSEDARYYHITNSYSAHVDSRNMTGSTHSEDSFGYYGHKNPDHLCTRSEGETVWMVRRAWCGNGVVEAGETCDDGNADDTDGCPRTCKGFVDATDCMDIQQASPDAPSGTYVVDPDGPGPGSPTQVWCDMETDGGGWTLCSAQGDAEPTVLGWGDKADDDNWYACHLFGGATTETRFHATDGAESHEWTFANLDHGAEVLLAPSDDQTAHLNIFKDTATCGEGPYPDNYQVELFSSQDLFGMSTQSAAGCSAISTVPSDASWLSIVSPGAVDKGCAEDHHIPPNLGYCAGGYPDVGASFEIYVRTARCGDGVVEGDEACDDDNDDESDGCTSSCETYGSALDCADVLSQAPGAPSGLYSLTTGAAWCDMERHGGGWTLVAVVSDDNQENWTWDNRNYWDTDTTTFGSVAQPHKDFKSAALHDLAFTDLLFVHAPSGVWAAYNQVGDGSGSLADTIGAYGGESIKWDYYGFEPVPGYPLTAGTLSVTGKMCTDQLYFNATDQDGSGYEYAYGPSWNANRNSTKCFDDPGIGATLGTGNYGPTDEEQLSMGFGEALELNTGEAGTGENH